MRREIVTAWISEEVLGVMAAEAERLSPKETGGVLLGYWTETAKEVVITDIIGPGPCAVHEERRFVPDTDYQEREIARIYEWSGWRRTYLGDWHSHPLSRVYLSRRDRKTLRRIAGHADARAPLPLMVILAGGSPWKLGIWQLVPLGISGTKLLQREVPLRVKTFQ
jgi:integrative and conjugative element protein (TIGR02256 family)